MKFDESFHRTFYDCSQFYLQGKGGCFDPKAPITREEFCVVLQRVMEAM